MTNSLPEIYKELVDNLDDIGYFRLQNLLKILDHEIRTNVTAINGLSNVLTKERKLSETQKMMIPQIQRRAETIRKVLDDLWETDCSI